MILRLLMKYLLKFLKKLQHSRYNPFKNWKKRLTFWLYFLVFGILLDEYIKEGYIFKPSDILVPLSHEQIALTLFIAGCFLQIHSKIVKHGNK